GCADQHADIRTLTLQFQAGSLDSRSCVAVQGERPEIRVGHKWYAFFCGRPGWLSRRTDKLAGIMIRLQNLTLQRGPQRLLEGAELTLHPGQKAGLIGANGAGKSTLFALLRGELVPDGGDC